MFTYYDAVDYFDKKLNRMLGRYNPKRGLVFRLVSESNYTGLSMSHVRKVICGHLRSKGYRYRGTEVDRTYVGRYTHHKSVTTDLVIKLTGRRGCETAV